MSTYGKVSIGIILLGVALGVLLPSLNIISEDTGKLIGLLCMLFGLTYGTACSIAKSIKEN